MKFRFAILLCVIFVGITLTFDLHHPIFTKEFERVAGETAEAADQSSAAVPSLTSVGPTEQGDSPRVDADCVLLARLCASLSIDTVHCDAAQDDCYHCFSSRLFAAAESTSSRPGEPAGLARLLIDAEAARSPVPSPGGSSRYLVLGGGCFWCMEAQVWREVANVTAVLAAYAASDDGGAASPVDYRRVSYELVSSQPHDPSQQVVGEPRWREVVLLVCEPACDNLAVAEAFVRAVDPFQDDGQFCDKGYQYQSAVYPLSPAQRHLYSTALSHLARVLDAPPPATIVHDSLRHLVIAEDYHQHYPLKHPTRFHLAEVYCGREGRLDQLWSPWQGRPLFNDLPHFL
mmetsp:Transcript_13545/g.42635  ORF Transcript_13545/g.42635 Transcript_13545/m.42635 type:complete len:345 (-) Transcript_13545:120-1154(-)